MGRSKGLMEFLFSETPAACPARTVSGCAEGNPHPADRAGLAPGASVDLEKEAG